MSVATPSVAPTADGRWILEGFDIAAVVEVGALVVEVVVVVVVGAVEEFDRVVVVVDRADAAIDVAVDVVVDAAAAPAGPLAVVVVLKGADATVDEGAVVESASFVMVEVTRPKGSRSSSGESGDVVAGSDTGASAVRASAEGTVVVASSVSPAASTVPDDEHAVSSSATKRSPTNSARR